MQQAESTIHNPAARRTTPFTWLPAFQTLLLSPIALCMGLLLLTWGATIAGYNNLSPIIVDATFNPSRVFNGFHEIEYEDNTPFRWTSGLGQICLEQVGRSAFSTLEITLLGKGASALQINEVTFLIDNQPITTANLRPATQHYHILLHNQYQSSDDICISIQSATAQSTIDKRQFGIPFESLTLFRQTINTSVTPALRLLGLNLALVAMGFWFLFALGIPVWLSALLVAIPTLGLGIGVAEGYLVPGMNTTRNLLPLIATMAILTSGTLATYLTKQRLNRYMQLFLGRFAVTYPRLWHDLLLMAFWSLVLWSGVWFMQAVYGHSGVWPLKAGIWPGFTLLILLPIAFFVAWLAVVLHLLCTHDIVEPAHPQSNSWYLLVLAFLLTGSFLLPVITKVAVRGWNSLFYTFTHNQSDYIHDVPRIDNPLTFLGHYVELSPTLAWHNSNHPPGSVLLFWFIEHFLVSGAVPASWVAIALSSLTTVAAFWLGLRLGGIRLGLLAGALCAVMPGHQVYSVTSMDGAFNGVVALGAVAFFLALEPPIRIWRAVCAGLIISIGLLLTYATTQLFFFGIALVGMACWQRTQAQHSLSFLSILQQTAIAAATLVSLYFLLALTTGFNIIEGSFQAAANNARLIGDTEAFVVPTIDHYIYYILVNIVPFGWYLAPWGLAALTPLILGSIRSYSMPQAHTYHIDPRIIRLTLAVLALVVGMWFSGLFIREVERIWGFVYPLAAVLIAHSVWQGQTSYERIWRAGLWISLFFAQSALMRMLLNTYW